MKSFVSVTLLFLGAFQGSSAQDFFGEMDDSTKFSLGCAAGGLPEVANYVQDDCINALGTATTGLYNAALVYATVTTNTADAATYGTNMAQFFAELPAVDVQCAGGTAMTQVLTFFGITASSASRTKLYKALHPFMPAGFKKAFPVNHKHQKGRLGAVSLETAIDAFLTVGDVFTVGTLAVNTATGLDNIVNNDNYLTGGFFSCQSVFGGWHDVYTAYIDFNDLLTSA